MDPNRCDGCTRHANSACDKKKEKRKKQCILKSQDILEVGWCGQCLEDYPQEDIIEDCILCPKCRQYCEICKSFVLKELFTNSHKKCMPCIQNGIKNSNIAKFGKDSYFKTHEYKESVRVYTYDLLTELLDANSAALVRVLDIPLNSDSNIKFVCECGEMSTGNFTIFKKTGKVRCKLCIKKYAHKRQKEAMVKKYGVENALHVPHLFEKLQRTSFKWKNYKLPSKRIIEVQGFEMFALDELFQMGYHEKHIKCGKGVSLPIINYVFQNKNKKYYPDIYIPKEKFIIEVKSNYTYKLHLDQNLAKKKACVDQGYKFKFWVYNRKGIKNIHIE